MCGSAVTDYRSPATNPSITGGTRPSRQWRRRCSPWFSMMVALVSSLTDAVRRMPRHSAVDIGQHIGQHKRRRGKPEVQHMKRRRGKPEVVERKIESS
jgi:hypothetical protein